MRTSVDRPNVIAAMQAGGDMYTQARDQGMQEADWRDKKQAEATDRMNQDALNSGANVYQQAVESGDVEDAGKILDRIKEIDFNYGVNLQNMVEKHGKDKAAELNERNGSELYAVMTAEDPAAAWGQYRAGKDPKIQKAIPVEYSEDWLRFNMAKSAQTKKFLDAYDEKKDKARKEGRDKAEHEAKLGKIEAETKATNALATYRNRQATNKSSGGSSDMTLTKAEKAFVDGIQDKIDSRLKMIEANPYAENVDQLRSEIVEMESVKDQYLAKKTGQNKEPKPGAHVDLNQFFRK